jgi:hypothetical protein
LEKFIVNFASSILMNEEADVDMFPTRTSVEIAAAAVVDAATDTQEEGEEEEDEEEDEEGLGQEEF